MKMGSPMVNDISKIGNSNFRFNIPYKIKDKSKIPFGNHISKKEIKDCKSVTFMFNCHKQFEYGESEDACSYELSVDFFMNNREFGIGGTIKRVDCIPKSRVEAAKTSLLASVGDMLSSMDLEIDGDAIFSMILNFESCRKELDNIISELVNYAHEAYTESTECRKE